MPETARYKILRGAIKERVTRTSSRLRRRRDCLRSLLLLLLPPLSSVDFLWGYGHCLFETWTCNSWLPRVHGIGVLSG